MFKFIYRGIYYRLLLAIETKINECLTQMVDAEFYTEKYRTSQTKKEAFEEMKDMIEFLRN